MASKHFNLRLPDDLRAKLDAEAKRTRRSRASLVIEALLKWLA